MSPVLPPLDAVGIVREAGLTAFVVFALTFSLVGFKVEDVPGGLDIVTRFDQVLAATVLAFTGRVVLILLHKRRHLPVILVGLAIAAVILGLVVAARGAPESATAAWLPFESVVVNVLVAVAALVLAGRAAWSAWRRDVGISDEEFELCARVHK
jgi:hypothetical protein